MSNSLLTPDMITREALRILHQKAVFIGSINRQYDDSFAGGGAQVKGKIGPSLRIRLPNEYTVRTGKVIAVQDTAEQSTTLTVSTQKGVDMYFDSQDLTLSLDDFSQRILAPAIAVLAANVEADVLSMYKDVYNLVDDDGNAFSFATAMNGKKLLTDNLAPMDDMRYGLLSTAHTVKFVDALKGLFHDQAAVRKQYREGMLGVTAGAEWRESTLVTEHTTGTAAKTTGYVTNNPVAGSSLAVDTGTTTFLKGDVITVADLFRVHPETKVSTGVLQQFVVTADSGASATSLSISPSIVTTGARQNVTGLADGKAVTKVGAGASELLNSSLVYHKDAFTVVTADLEMPKGVDFASRQVMDGISMRIVRDYDVVNDQFPCRIDVLYGYLAIRPQLAARLHADG